MSSVGLSKFVTESEVEEAKKKRQEEWDRVRKPEDPESAPEPEVQDLRPLYDRLEENRLRKEAEKEESKKLKHLVKGLDSEEVEFLEQVDQIRMKNELREREEERKELEAFKLRSQFVHSVGEPEIKIDPTKKPSQSRGSSKSQASLLAGAIKRKTDSASDDAQNKKARAARDDTPKVLGVLPGLGHYETDSSDVDSDESSADEAPCSSGCDILSRSFVIE
ncbi:PSME3-interacting protein [Galendromus occidentalis]|uniref:PSME3-interacting protein n=1 Tax=Galendromus occidentalis TaxID=34638 RepID=A0AAJ6QXQ6_9ACAR|nr:PSME3-interacting protein [Galendromus occidentalis]